MNIKEVLNQLKDRAAEILKNPEQTYELINNVQKKKTKKAIPKFSSFKDQMELAIAMVKDFVSGKYTKVPWQSLLLIIGSFIYFLNPLDMIPDIVPLTGLLDDASVLVYVLKSIKDDLDEYQLWKHKKDEAMSKANSDDSSD